jgi:nitrogenase molybdenum-iron protein alpha/beta subunit
MPAVKTGTKPVFYSKGLISGEPLHGCAFSGAMSVCTQLNDCICIAHGPDSCSHITYQSITSIPRRFLLERGVVLPMQSCPPIVSSEMNESVMIFGGIDELRKKINDAKAKKPEIIFIVTTCPSGIIGDNIESVQDMEDENTKIIPVLADGNLQGDYLQGILMAYMKIAGTLIDKNVLPEENIVNIVAEKPETNARKESLRYVTEILDKFGIGINCHFLCETSGDEIRKFKRAKLNILAYGDYMGRTIRDFLQNEFGAEFLDMPFPVGYKESCEWVRRVGTYFNKTETIEPVLSVFTKRYCKEIDIIKPYLKGKKLMVVTYNHDIDWILQTACDLGMKIAFVGILNFSQDNRFRTDYSDHIGELHLQYDYKNRKADLKRIKPDILLTNYSSVVLDGDILTDTIPLCPTAGFLSGVLLAKRWSELFKMNLKEGWKRDDILFGKYYS